MGSLPSQDSSATVICKLTRCLARVVPRCLVLTFRTGGLPGGQSEYVRVPFGEVNCLKVPKGVPGKFTCLLYLNLGTVADFRR